VDAPLAALLELEVLDDVGDVDLAAVDPHRGQRLVELAARRSHEGVTLAVLAVAGHLADHGHPRALEPLAEHRLGGGRVEVAAAAAGGGLAQ